MSKRIIVHIGTYKTGTTSIQTHLHNVLDELKCNGILYPSTGLDRSFHGHHVIAPEASGRSVPADGQSVLKKLHHEIAEARNADTVIISSERLCSLKQLQPLVDLFAGHRVEVIMSVRPQDEFLNAMYYTSLMGRRHGLTPEKYATGSVTKVMDYHAILLRWRAAFPDARFIVRVYEKGSPARQDAIRDFVNSIGLEEDIPVPEQRISSHPTLPACATLALLSLIKAELLPNKDFFQVFKALHKVFADRREETSVYSPSARRATLERYRDSNRALRREFLDGESGDLFSPAKLPTDESWAAVVGGQQDSIAKVLMKAARFILLNDADDGVTDAPARV